MKIEVAKQDLEHALQVAALTVGSGNDLSSHYLFRVTDGEVEINTYDTRIFSGSPLSGCNHDGEDGDAFTVEAWRLSKWMDGVGDGVLKFTYEGDGQVTAKGPRSTIRFRSLDPSKWPHNDELLALSEEVGRCNPAVLARAFNLLRWFVSSDDTSKPELCQIEAIDGVCWATDRRALSSVKIEELPELGIRVPGKDLGSVLRFLSDKDCKEVVIKKAVRPLKDGGGENFTLWKGASYIGIPRPPNDFPSLNVDKSLVPPVHLEIDRDEFKAACAVLLAGAPKGHESVTFSLEKDVVHVSMPCEAGGSDSYPLNLASVDNPDKWVKEFVVDTQYIQGIADVFGLDRLKFGVVDRGRGGYLSFHYAEDDAADPNDYFSVIVWRT